MPLSVESYRTRARVRKYADRRPGPPDRTRPLSQLARRDFLNGVALTVGGALGPPLASPPESLGVRLADVARGGARYPPARRGRRGSHDGSFEVAHALRDGA